jgi:hypothetical protein
MTAFDEALALHRVSPIEILDEAGESSDVLLCEHCDALANPGTGEPYESVMWPCPTAITFGVSA